MGSELLPQHHAAFRVRATSSPFQTPFSLLSAAIARIFCGMLARFQPELNPVESQLDLPAH
jgi:hypothetical protein